MKTQFQVAARVAILGFGVLAAGCAAPTSDEITTEDEATALTQEELLVLKPELQFNPRSFIVSTGGGVITVPEGSTFKVPCSQTQLPVRYQYRNASPAGAGAHVNKMTVGPWAAVGTPQAPMAGGTSRITGAVLNIAAVPPNVFVPLAAYLDSGAAVSELNEGNNSLVIRFIRSCQ